MNGKTTIACLFLGVTVGCYVAFGIREVFLIDGALGGASDLLCGFVYVSLFMIIAENDND